MKDDFLKKVLDRLSVCLTYAGEDIEDFLWVLDQDERDGYAPADVERLRGIYRQIKDQYAQDGRDLQLGMSTEDCLDLAVHMVELYQAMYDYLMSDGPEAGEATVAGTGSVRESREGREGRESTADFEAMFELFRKGKDLPS